MDVRYAYPTSEDIVTIHDKIIAKSGGMTGVRDIGLIDSAIYHIQNDLYYPNIIEKVVHLIYSINKGHAFNDGNKRTSLSSAIVFLVQNGLNDRQFIGTFVGLMEDVVVWLADGKIDKSQLLEVVSFAIIKHYGVNGWFDFIVSHVQGILYMNQFSYDLAMKKLSKLPITHVVGDDTKKLLEQHEIRNLIYTHCLKYK